MKYYVDLQNIDSPFIDPDGTAYLARHGIVRTGSIFAADVVVTCRVRRTRARAAWLPWKRFVVWTNEPHYDFTPGDAVFRRTLVRNVYSGRVFFHNRHFLQTYYCRRDASWLPGADSVAAPCDPARFSFGDRPGGKTLCFVFGRRPDRDAHPLVAGTAVNLEPVRTRLAEEAHRAGRGHIYGRGWPPGVAVENSSGTSRWWVRKIQLLSGYRFAAALENAAFPYYCTEKIWQAILAGCLPVYWARGTAIHETFPEGSFLDASRFGSTQELLECIAAMQPAEFCGRFNRCAEVFAREQSRRREELASDDRVEFRELVADLRAWAG